MADNEQNDETNLNALAQNAAALDTAIAQARDELIALHGAASHGDQLSANAAQENASIHEVQGVGRYAIPSRPGWQALLEVIHDRSADIDYSSTNYPVFDAVIAQVTESGPLDDSLEDDYEHALWVHLRENIAAVRNFLMQTYYADTPDGMSQDKAKDALEQIADYVGGGLHNNLRFLGLVPNHDPNKPFIDLHKAAEPNGAGAQYLYEKILEMQRQSSWMRPFAAVVALFGGKAPMDWMLPSPDVTPFGSSWFGGVGTVNGDPLMDADARLRMLENQRQQLQEKMEATTLAVDLEAMGNQLLTTAAHLQDVSSLSEPVRRDAVEIAREILRKLKVTMGSVQVLDGLNVKQGDGMASFGALSGVAKVYERVLAWGRGIDPTIMNDPAVMAATQTIGQMGYLAKMQALQMAKSIGNTVLADRLAARIAQLPQAFKITQPTRMADMLDRVERGIDTVLNRVQAIGGPNAMVGHSPAKDISGYMSAAPTAGLAMQASAEGVGNRDAVGKRNAEIMLAEDAALQAQAARIQSQNARRTADTQQNAPARPARGQQAVQQAKNVQQRQSTSGTAVNPNVANLTAQQRALMLRQNAIRAAHDHDEHEHHPTPQKINPSLINPALMNQIKAATNTTGMVTPVTGTPRPATNMYGQPSSGLKPMATPNAKPTGAAVKPAPTSDEEKRRQLLDMQAPPPPSKGGGRGF